VTFLTTPCSPNGKALALLFFQTGSRIAFRIAQVNRLLMKFEM
jgi:hypothetical protein